MVSRDGTARLRNDIWHGDVRRPANGAQGVHHVVGVLLNGIVHTGGMGRPGTVIVHPQAATNIDVGNGESHPPEFGVVPGDFLQPDLDGANIGDLGSQMEMHHSQEVLLASRLQTIQQFDETRGAQSELRLLSPALGPTARPSRAQFDPDPHPRGHPDFLGYSQEGVQLTQLFQDHEHLVSHALRREGQTHVFGVLVPIADDRVTGVATHPQHRLEFGLAAALEAHSEGRPELEDLLHHVALLIDLDRIHEVIPTAVVEFRDGAGKSVRHVGDPGPQDVREAQQNRQTDALFRQVDRQPVQVESRSLVSRGVNRHVACSIHAEKPESPLPHAVERLGLGRTPGRVSGRRCDGSRSQGGDDTLLMVRSINLRRARRSGYRPLAS